MPKHLRHGSTLQLTFSDKKNAQLELLASSGEVASDASAALCRPVRAATYCWARWRRPTAVRPRPTDSVSYVLHVFLLWAANTPSGAVTACWIAGETACWIAGEGLVQCCMRTLDVPNAS